MNFFQELPPLRIPTVPKDRMQMRIPHRRTRSSVSCHGDNAKAFAAEQDKMALHPRNQAALALPRKGPGADRDFALATNLRNISVSSDHRPPTSTARTMSLALPGSPANSGTCVPCVFVHQPEQLRFWMPRDPGRSHPHAELTPTWCRSQVELHRKGATHLQRPPNSDCHHVFVDTLAPASRHNLAAADSKAAPLPFNTPETAHADRWWPNTSWRRPHRHAFAARGMGRQSAQQQDSERLGSKRTRT